jgi:hypothetical protein
MTVISGVTYQKARARILCNLSRKGYVKIISYMNGQQADTPHQPRSVAQTSKISTAHISLLQMQPEPQSGMPHPVASTQVHRRHTEAGNAGKFRSVWEECQPGHGGWRGRAALLQPNQGPTEMCTMAAVLV